MSPRPHIPSLTALAACAICCLTPTVRPAPLLAQQDPVSTRSNPDTIRLRRSMFALKYQVGDSVPRHVIDPWLGASLRSSFVDVLAAHPPALAEAQRASPYLTLRLVGNLAFTAGFVLFLMDALDSPGATPAQLRENSTGNVLRDAVVYIGLPGAVMVVGARFAQNHINRAIDLFNADRRGAAPDVAAVSAAESVASPAPAEAGSSAAAPARRATSAQHVERGFSATVIPSYQTFGGPDYEGVEGGLGIEGSVHYNFGRTAVGVGYRRHGHGFDLSELGPVPGGFDASVRVGGPHVDLRRTFVVDPESRATLYVGLYGARLTQSVVTSSSGVRVSLDSKGFAAGSGVGVHYALSPMLDLAGEWSLGGLWFDDFSVLQQQAEGSDTAGLEMAFKLGARVRLARLLAGT